MGADSAAVGSDYGLTVRKDEKLFARGPYLMGFTSSYRTGQLLRYGGNIPNPPSEIKDLHRFMCTDFVNSVRALFKEGGFGGYKEEGWTGDHAGEFLVGVRGRLFEVMADYQVAEPIDTFASVGSGASVALGALYATRAVEDPEMRIRLALEAAEHHNAGVRAPFAIMAETADMRRFWKN